MFGPPNEQEMEIFERCRRLLAARGVPHQQHWKDTDCTIYRDSVVMIVATPARMPAGLQISAINPDDPTWAESILSQESMNDRIRVDRRFSPRHYDKILNHLRLVMVLEDMADTEHEQRASLDEQYVLDREARRHDRSAE